MRVIRVSRRRIRRDALAAAAAVIRDGVVVAFPTETAYGLAADPTSAKAIRKIFHVTVSEVRTQTVHGKMRRVGRTEGRKPSWKKAIVTLKEGEKIDLS